MKHQFTLEYWQDEGAFVGRLREVPGVFSQGETLKELEANVADAYELVMSESAALPSASVKSKPLLLKVA
ncbi:MAG: type II toxin-antitoxin system HicB family antitoxin [Panacagrimonas sp.]